MPSLLPRASLTVGALCCGAVLGYFVLDAPIIPLAAESVVDWFVPPLKDVDAWLSVRGLHFLLVGTLIFIAAIPNVVLLSILTAVSMRLLRRPRLVFYAALVWPVLHYFFNTTRVLRIMGGLKRLGINPDLNAILTTRGLDTQAVTAFLVYCLFSILVFLSYRWAQRIWRHPLASTGAQAG